jgi:hypothetical protein
MEVQTNRLGHLVDNFLLLFVGLKLAGLIEWSWLWVTAPFWGSMLAAFLYAFGRSWHKQTQRQAWIKMKRERKQSVAESDG